MNREPSFLNDPPRFSRGEYWILESLVEMRTPISFFGGDPRLVASRFNKPPHGLGPAELVATLDSLFRRGLVAASRGEEALSVLASGTEEIPALLSEPSPREDPNCTFCGLTPLGGRLWEAFAMPDWRSYLVHASTVGREESDDWDETVVESIEPRQIEAFVRGLDYVGTRVDAESFFWEEVEPWEATYWKTLPQACRLAFRSQPNSEVPDWDAIPWGYMEIYERRWYRWM